jgi:hypothetical protein
MPNTHIALASVSAHTALGAFLGSLPERTMLSILMAGIAVQIENGKNPIDPRDYERIKEDLGRLVGLGHLQEDEIAFLK